MKVTLKHYTPLEIADDAIGKCYKVSPFGMITNIKTGRILKLDENQRYSRVSLRINGKLQKWLVHRLVAVFYIPNPDNLEIVNHKDGNTHNNNVHNLEWCTQKENVQHAHNAGLVIKSNCQIESAKETIKKAQESRVALTRYEIYLIDSRIKNGAILKELATEYNVSRDTISRIKNRKGHYASYFTS